MSFALLPAVDVADGQSVRLVQGEVDSGTRRGDPLDVALSWQADGASWIHLVDLDAAFGRGSNGELLASIVDALDVNVQLSGGVHDDASLDGALSMNCARIVLATTSLSDLAWCNRVIAEHGERVAIGLDVRIEVSPRQPTRHRLAARGQDQDFGDLWETLNHLDQAGCARYVVTDVSRDGMLGGANIGLYEAVTNATSAPVIVSGGISSISDLVELAELAARGVNLEGSIVGKALYAGRFTLPAALEAVRDVDLIE